MLEGRDEGFVPFEIIDYLFLSCLAGYKKSEGVQGSFLLTGTAFERCLFLFPSAAVAKRWSIPSCGVKAFFGPFFTFR
jgi:hypothetical protein